MQAKKDLKPKVKRKKKKIWGDTSRVITRPHIPGGENRIPKIIQRIAGLPDTTAEDLLAQIMLDFSERHKDIRRVFERSLNEVRDHVPRDTVLSETKKALIGAYFTMEYSIESSAFFNPAIVEHPDQSETGAGEKRVIISFRATGEGHISSIVFRLGVLDHESNLSIQPVGKMLEEAEHIRRHIYDKESFKSKLDEMKDFVKEIDKDVYEWLDPELSLKRRNIPGGTGPEMVKKSLKMARKELAL